jgi:hypothetical protein
MMRAAGGRPRVAALYVGLLLIATGSGRAQVPEIPDATLREIAVVRPDPRTGAVIIYNPIRCQQVGAACGFFRAHEYGHVAMRHQIPNPRAWPAQREAAADCWAAHNAHPQETLAAVQLFLAGGSSGNWQVYGDPVSRARRVRNCAIRAGRWAGR